MRVVNLIASVVLGVGGFSVIGLAAAQAPTAQPLSAPAIAAVALRPLPTLLGVLAPPPPPAPVAKAPVETAKPPSEAAKNPPAQPKVAAPPKAGAAPPPNPAPPAPVGEGTLTMQASDTADVYLDGKKLGSSPQSVKARAGGHRVRFDCYDAAGNTVTGAVKTVTLAADQDLEVPFQCPDAQ